MIIHFTGVIMGHNVEYDILQFNWPSDYEDTCFRNETIANLFCNWFSALNGRECLLNYDDIPNFLKGLQIVSIDVEFISWEESTKFAELFGLKVKKYEGG